MDFCHSSCALISKAMWGCSASKWPFEKSACHTCGFVMWVTDLESVNKYILSKYTVDYILLGTGKLICSMLKSSYYLIGLIISLSFSFLGKNFLFKFCPQFFLSTWSFNYLYKTKSKHIITKCVLVCSLKNIC